MGTDLLSDIRREIDERLRALRPALAEYEQLLEAADALGLDDLTDGAAPARPAAKRRTAHRTARSPRTAPDANKAECEAILGALEHGSHTVGELAVVTAMRPAAINGNLRRLAAQGLVAKTEREGKPAWSLVATD